MEAAIDPSNPHCEIWYDSIVKELTNIDEAETFKDADPQGRGAKTKTVFRSTYDNEMKPKAKARLVYCGYSQIFGLDYKHTYAPTVPMVVVFVVFYISGHFHLQNSIFDVTAAFLEAYNDYEQYCYLPKGLLGPSANYRKLVWKALYGEKQSPLLWYLLLNGILCKMKYVRCPDCYCLYMYYNPINGDLMIICIHVDDGFMAFNRIGMDEEFIKELSTHVKNATLSKTNKKFLGMELRKTETHLELKYITQPI